MSDSLRDRIAAVLDEHERDEGEPSGYCMCGEIVFSDEMASHRADAVIAGLRSDLAPLLAEYSEARQYDADCGEADNSGNDAGDKLARFVTDWTTG